MAPKEKIRWSINVQRLAEVIGAPAAMRLVDEFGGGEDYFIPRQPGKTAHCFSKILSPPQFKALCEAYGPGYIEIPRGAYRNLKKARILDATGPSRVVARQVGVVQRYVRKVRSDAKIPSPQLSLFDKK